MSLSYTSVSEIKTFVGLVDFIAKQYPELSLKDVAKKKIGISEKSFFEIRKGSVPQKKLQRILKSFVEKNFNFTYNQPNPNSTNIQIKYLVIGDKNITGSKDTSINVAEKIRIVKYCKLHFFTLSKRKTV
jgi:hypothetical protein